MSFLKTAGIIVTLISAFITDMSLIRQIKSRTEALRQAYLMIDYIEISIKYQNTDMKEIFERISQSEKFSLLPFISDFSNKNFDFDLSSYDFKSIKIKNVFTSHCCELLSGYFAMLGKSDTDGQLANCRTYKDFFMVEIEKAENTEEGKIKTTSSIIFGVTLLLLIIIL